MKFKADAEPQAFGDFFYELCNGYIDPEKLLESPEDSYAVWKAVVLLLEFRDDGLAAGKLEGY